MKIIIMLLLLIAAGQLKAQDIEVTRFERNYTSLIASMSPEYDNNGEACAVLRFFVRDNNLIIEPNLGKVKQEMLSGEIRVWVPQGTKRLTVRQEGKKPLTGYEIPLEIEAKVTYEVDLEVNNGANKGHNVYASAGYNIISISGPSVAIGFDIAHHNIELGAVYGVNKTDDLYFYDAKSNLMAAYNYKAIRVQLRYGYDITITDFFSVMPQVGGAYNIYTGAEIVKGKDYGSANSLSVIAAIRLVASFSDRFKLHITPEFDFGAYKDDNNKMIANYDSNFKSWTNGFNLNVGLMYFF